MSRHRRHRRAAATILGLFAAGTLLGGPAAPAQTTDDGGLGGYAGRAQASGLHVFYNPEGALPVAAPGDVGSPDALTTISSGPSTFARASVADPGDLLANPDALLTQGSPDYPEGTFPAYPFRVEASSSIGEPVAESNPGPGLQARAEAQPQHSEARASSPAAAAPGVGRIGSMSSRSSTELDGDSVTVRARTEVSGFDLAGVLTIESIVTEVVATSRGEETELSGGTTITGASLAGQPVTIDEEGMHLDEGDERQSTPLLGPVVDAVGPSLIDVLDEVGIRISLPGPIVAEGGRSGELASTGLQIRFELSDGTRPELSELLRSLPSTATPLDDVIALAQARHISVLEVGRAAVSLTTTPAFVPPPFEAAVPGHIGPSAPAAGPSGLTPAAPLPAPSTAEAIAPRAPAPTFAAGPTASEAPALSVGAGIGALAALALLVQPALGHRLARGAATILATSPADTCPLEKP